MPAPLAPSAVNFFCSARNLLTLSGSQQGMRNGMTPRRKTTRVISPTACRAPFSARTTTQPSQSLVEASWNPRGTLLKPWWNPRGTLVEPYLKATPEPIWAETPKLSAVGEQSAIWSPFYGNPLPAQSPSDSFPKPGRSFPTEQRFAADPQRNQSPLRGTLYTARHINISLTHGWVGPAFADSAGHTHPVQPTARNSKLYTCMAGRGVSRSHSKGKLG